MILPLTVEQEEWLKIFFSEQKGRVREKIDEMMIDSLLGRLKPREHKFSEGEFFTELADLFRKYQFTYGKKLDVMWTVLTRQYFVIMHDAKKVEDTEGMNGIKQGMVKDILKRQANMIESLKLVGQVEIEYNEEKDKEERKE